MNALFLCDWIIYKDSENQYYDITLKTEIIDRYKRYSSNLTIATRVIKIESYEQVKNYHKLDNELSIVELPNLLSFPDVILNFKKTKLILSDLIKNNDLIYMRLPSFYSILAYKYLKKFKKNYFVELGGCAWDSHWYHGVKGKVMAPYMFFKTRLIVKNSKYVSYVTKKFLQKRYPNSNITNSVSNVVINHIDQKVLELRVDKINNFKIKRLIVIGTVAAVDVKYKGHADVLKMIKLLVNNNFNIRYELVGAGNINKISKLAKKMNLSNNISFLGVMKHKEVLKWMDNIDIYIQPSKQEGLPRALIEAMSRACPAIGSDIAGIPELLSKEFRFKKGNIDEMLESFLSVLDNQIYAAKQNFEKSKEYLFYDLELERNKLFKQHFEDIKKVNWLKEQQHDENS